MQRQSQEALDQLTTSEEIISSIETHGVEVAAILEEKWTAMAAPPDSTPSVDAPNPPDYLGHLLALRDGLTASAGSLSQADQIHVHQLARLIQLREDREEIKEGVYDKFSTARRTLDELLGDGKAFVLAGIEGPTARTCRKLLRQVDLALPRLDDPGLEGARPKIDGITVDPKAMARDLATLADKLRVVQAEFHRARRVVQASRKEKNRRLKEHRSNNTWTARIVEGYYQLAGETELAERLRPVVARPGRPPAPTPPDETPTPEPAPDAAAPDVAAPNPPAADEPVKEEESTAEGLTLQGLRANLPPVPSATDA